MQILHTKLIKKITELWSQGYTDGFQECCHRMHWKCEVDYRYPTDHYFKVDSTQMFAVTDLLGTTVYVIQEGMPNEDLEIVLYAMGPEELLYLFQCLGVQKYK
jgi:hypothetical protein